MEGPTSTSTGWSSRLHTVKESCRPSSIRSRARSWNWHRLIVSFWGCISFVGLGTSMILFGSTLLDIASHLSVGVGVLAVMFTCRAIGSGIGSVSTGVIFDKFPSWSYTTLSVITFACLAILGIFMFCNGIATGALGNGVHAVLMRLWGSKSGPCMQILHFSWSFGAFIAPLIAKCFFREVSDDKKNDTMYNLTCSDIWTNSSTVTESTIAIPTAPGVDYDCFLTFIETCKNLTNSLYYYYYVDEPNLADYNCTMTTSPTSEAPTDFIFAYFIAASLFLPSLVAFIFYAVRRECLGKCCSKLAIARRQSELKDMHKMDDAASDYEEEFGKPPLCFTILFFSQLFCFMFLYVGLEAGFGSLIFTVAVTGQLGFLKSTAAVLQSVYWGTFCFTRMISVTCALFGVRASIMIMGNLFGSFIASLIMIFYIHNALAIWIGSAVLGMSYASIFPTTMTWMSENTKATGKAIAVLVTAGTVGDITLPAVMGVMVAKVSPDSLIYVTFIGVIISAATAAVMFLTACLQKRRLRAAMQCDIVPTHTVKYETLTVDSNPQDLEDTCKVELNDVGDLSKTCIVNGDATWM